MCNLVQVPCDPCSLDLATQHASILISIRGWTLINASVASDAQLQEEVASEDPRNGELTVRVLDRPFIDLPNEDKNDVDSWAV